MRSYAAAGGSNTDEGKMISFAGVVGGNRATFAEAGYEVLKEQRPAGHLRRILAVLRHSCGLLSGGLVAWVRACPRAQRRGFKFRTLWLGAWVLRPWVQHALVKEPFPVQLRRRFEMLGPTYIKLGQILSLREDILPRPLTDELKKLLNRLPAVRFERFLELVEDDLERPIEEMFSWVDPVPTGSASIAQIHRATTREGDSVILKAVKPGICQALERDARLLGLLGEILQVFLSRYQPQRVLREFTDYTLKEVDLKREADNIETFAALFADLPAVKFPRVYREYSGSRVLCMEFLSGIRPDAAAAAELGEAVRDQVIELGATAIIRMLYRDGFFHADLHPGNILLLPGSRIGFIDLGMVGRLDEETRRTLLYYYYCLVAGDPRNAARYLTQVADPGPGSDVRGFQRAVEEVSRRWHRAANFNEFSLGQLILESVTLGARFRMYFPVELILMVKALVTYEGVGHLLKPGFDVAAASRLPITQIFLQQFNPWTLTKESLRNAPELIDAVIKAPLLITEGLRLLERSSRRPAENPLSGVRGTIFGGFCLVAGAILGAAGRPAEQWMSLVGIGFLIAWLRVK